MKVSSDRLNRISVSQTFEISQRSQLLRAKGIDVVDLSIGQPDFKTPDHIKQAAIEAINEDYTFYTPVAGYKDLREAVSEKFRKENNLDYRPEEIVVSNGAKQSLANVMLSLVNHGDEVLIPVPYWVSYAEINNLAHGVNVYIPSSIKKKFKVTPEDIKKKITDKTRVFLFNSPSNPAGTVYTRDELEAIANVFRDRPDIYIISDEIYEHINYIGGHESIAQFDFIKDRVVIINGVSKGFAMTGWRIGYMAGPKWIVKSCEKLQGQYTSGACSIAQRAALSALTSPMLYTMGMNAAFQRRRDITLKLLKEIPGVKTYTPDGAFYIFPDFSDFYGTSDGYISIKNSQDLCLYLLNEAHVATVPGSAFGDNNCIRMSYANNRENITEAIRRIKEALSRLKKPLTKTTPKNSR